MVLLARRAAQLCTKRYASQPHDPRTLRARRLLSTETQKQDPRTLSGAWSFLQRANPFTVWGETIGREPSDRLPKVTDLVKAVVADMPDYDRLYQQLIEADLADVSAGFVMEELKHSTVLPL